VITYEKISQLLNDSQKASVFPGDRTCYIRDYRNVGAQETRWSRDANESGISAFHGNLQGVKEVSPDSWQTGTTYRRWPASASDDSAWWSLRW